MQQRIQNTKTKEYGNIHIQRIKQPNIQSTRTREYGNIYIERIKQQKQNIQNKKTM